MITKQFNYGEKRMVTVLTASRDIITVTDGQEGYILLYHGLKRLPKENDTGLIVFEPDQHSGHWQFYPIKISQG